MRWIGGILSTSWSCVTHASILCGDGDAPKGRSPYQEIDTMTRMDTATSLLDEAATYALATAFFGGFVILIEAALSRLVY
jgi:hypothetical protein